MSLLYLLSVSLVTVFVEPLGWCAILAALLAGVFFDRLWVILGLVAGSATARFWLSRRFTDEPTLSTQGLLDTLNSMKPWVDSATIATVVLAVFFLVDTLSTFWRQFRAARHQRRN
jgi:hypothetical protein